MKITVLNGSPKGDLSVTMQYVKFMEKKFGEHEFSYINISQRIGKIESDDAFFNEIISEVANSDLTIWGTPLYVCLVPSQYKRFIELIWERGAEEKFRDKYAAVITTSIHFFDNTAHNYMRGICEDLGMRFAGSFSPDMYDIMQEEGREKILTFAQNIFRTVESGVVAARAYIKPDYNMPVYTPGKPLPVVDASGRKVLILSDKTYQKGNVAAMIGRMKNSLTGDVETLSLSDIDIKGGCMGCCECGFDYRCTYTGKDEFIDFYNEKLKKADIIIFAGEIRDRYLSAKWKQMFDRAFFNTHTPTLKGKQFGLLLSGPLAMIPNLREVLNAYFQWQGANLVEIITDEHSSSDMDILVDSLAKNLVSNAEAGYVAPPTFLGVGGMKIFRDDIWGRLRFVFQADHKYYEENGIYDFPQDDLKAIEMNKNMINLTSKPEMRENVRKMIKTEMVKPMKHIVETK
ncbi:MAG TPA: NAD(P)H-dependent oxidoreductase [Spirochaetota bacterium]|nr:NAD(P)H-dependent oxidoreductase [Spirochaetota bacterium]HPJ36061.1 NAD(P)H-dependent oxidoreductase [Spirochaetota bacterium]